MNEEAIAHVGLQLQQKKKLCTYSHNLLKPTGYVMHHHLTFNVCMLYQHCIYVSCIYLGTNRDFCPMQHKLTGFYN